MSHQFILIGDRLINLAQVVSIEPNAKKYRDRDDAGKYIMSSEQRVQPAAVITLSSFNGSADGFSTDELVYFGAQRAAVLAWYEAYIADHVSAEMRVAFPPAPGKNTSVERLMMAHRDQFREYLAGAVAMYREFVDQHGYLEDAAAVAGVDEVIEGIEAMIELDNYGELVDPNPRPSPQPIGLGLDAADDRADDLDIPL